VAEPTRVALRLDYNRWRLEHAFVLVPAQQYVGQFLSTFKEFPQRQKVGSFSLDRVLESLTKGAGDKWRRAG
jgi:arylsulfatase